MPPGPAVGRPSAGLRSAGLRSAAARAVPGPAFAALMRAVYPRLEPELACLDTWAPRGGTAVDVGAWYGPWTAALSRLAAQVVSIEPNPELARLVRARFPAAMVVEAAASDRDGTAQLWLPPGGRGAEGTASLERARDKQSGGGRRAGAGAERGGGTSTARGRDKQSGGGRGARGREKHSAGAGQAERRGGRSITVRRVTVDGLGLTGVRFIKMDVEGHEAAALRGAEQTIMRDSPVLLIELETRHQRIEDVIGTLTGWGYHGTVLAGRSWVPLPAFDLPAHQSANSHVAARGMLGRLARPGERYINLVRFQRA
jgi:FkbM family methyltransferase